MVRTMPEHREGRAVRGGSSRQVLVHAGRGEGVRHAVPGSEHHERGGRQGVRDVPRGVGEVGGGRRGRVHEGRPEIKAEHDAALTRGVSE